MRKIESIFVIFHLKISRISSWTLDITEQKKLFHADQAMAIKKSKLQAKKKQKKKKKKKKKGNKGPKKRRKHKQQK